MNRIYATTFKKVFLSTFIVLFSMVSFAATYYVSNTGNDSNSGLTTALPWQTLTKVNATTFKSGDQILFQKGNTFYGSLTISSSGSVGAPIIFGAYGSGVNPIITGFTAVTSWTNLGSNIWESASPVSTLSTCNMVVVNGVNTAMGRYPNANTANSGYLTFQSHAGSTAITSSSLSGSPNWAGAELVMRENHYLMERFTISSQSGGTLNFSPASVYAPLDGFGFFIQNDVRTLDVQNEWYYNPSTKKIRIYSALQPSNVKVASVTSLFSANGNYITASGIDFSGSNGDNIAGRGTNTTIQSCNVSFSGMNHISTSGAYYTAIDNTFKDTNNNGISVEGSYSIISRNTLTNSGIYQGMGRTAGLGINSALSVGGTGNTDYTIEGNTIINSGFNGIAFYGNNVIVKNNYIDTFCSVLDDGGGIYTYTGSRTKMVGTKIYGNIVINGIGGPNGVSSSFPTIAAGIYCDEESANVEIYNNTTANTSQFGIFQNINHDNNIHDNTVYNASMAQFRATWSTNITFNNNIFVSKTATEYVSYISSGSSPAIPQMVISNNNYYARPIDDNKVIFVEQPGVGGTANFETLAEWKTFSGQDANSNKSPQSITSVNDLQFEYNATRTAKTVTLSRPMIDVKGTKYATTVTLQPYTSVVLMKDNTATSVVTGESISPTVASIAVNASQQLIATVSPSTATNTNISWSSSNPSVAPVSSSGLVSGVAAGSATITATTQDGGKTATCAVTVSSPSGGTIGSNTIGGNSESGVSGYWIASSFTPVTNMTVNRMNLYVNSAKGNARLGIYSSSSTEPGTLLAQTGELPLVNGWNSGTLGSAQTLVAGVTYWLAFEVSSSTIALRYNPASGRSRYYSTAYGPLPGSAIVKCSVGTGIYSIYADNNGLKSALAPASEGLPTLTTYKEDLTRSMIIDVFPNPSNGNITVRFPDTPPVGSRIDIFDLAGRRLVSRLISAPSELFNLDFLPNGIYLVKSTIGNIQSVNKLSLNR